MAMALTTLFEFLSLDYTYYFNFVTISYFKIIPQMKIIISFFTAFLLGTSVNLAQSEGSSTEAAPTPMKLTGDKIISNYTLALGGAEKLAMVRDLSTRLSGSIEGLTLDITSQLKNGKMAIGFSFSGSLINQQIFDGKKGIVIEMGEKKSMDRKQLEAMKIDALPFPELKYKELGVSAELVGFENVKGKKSYKVIE